VSRLISTLDPPFEQKPAQVLKPQLEAQCAIRVTHYGRPRRRQTGAATRRQDAVLFSKLPDSSVRLLGMRRAPSLNMLGLYLLEIAIVLIVLLRRTQRRLKPLRNELSAKDRIVSQIQTGVACVRKDGNIGWLNPAIAEFLQIASQDLTGHEWYELFTPEDRARVREDYRQMLLIGKLSLKARGLRADGSFVWFDVQLIPLRRRWKRFAGHHCLVTDVTREVELEEKLDQAREVEIACAA
jgi:PAS domain S-box-containing protein